MIINIVTFFKVSFGCTVTTYIWKSICVYECIWKDSKSIQSVDYTCST